MSSHPLALVEGQSRHSFGSVRSGSQDASSPLLDVMLDLGTLAPADAQEVANNARHDWTPTCEYVHSMFMLDEADILRAQSLKCGARIVDPATPFRQPELLEDVDIRKCIKKAIIPLRNVGSATLVVTSSPTSFAADTAHLPDHLHPLKMALATRHQITDVIANDHKTRLAELAESRVHSEDSCRHLSKPTSRTAKILCLLGFSSVALFMPKVLFAALIGWAILSMFAVLALRVWASIVYLCQNLKPRKETALFQLPTVSILVPLLNERNIAGQLVRQLSRLDYPREKLDVCLITEASDKVTQTTLRETILPHWIRVHEVPKGSLKTKPRAMNYALDFCRGSIIGIYDAEDAPEPDQLLKIVHGFANRPAEVACLQGALDFYNPKQNWMSRCFTLEYATWFRLILPGFQALGLPIPLGGTTVFFRRHVLEELGGWDAHNVTEDAELGMRLAKAGYRTELIDTTTYEEACCAPRAWIRQRSRWLKGYAATYMVLMKDPKALFTQLGWRGFLGVQLIFLCTLSQFALAPLILGLWLLPVQDVASSTGISWLTSAIVAMFFMAEVANITVTALATRRAEHRRFWIWIPTLHAYFFLASLACYKALWELIRDPFYWDKTSHGKSLRRAQPSPAGAKSPLPRPLRRPHVGASETPPKYVRAEPDKHGRRHRFQ